VFLSLNLFSLFIQEEFSIGDKEIKLTEIRRNAEITSPRCLKEEGGYSIEEGENNLDNPINSAPPNNSSDLNQSNGNGTRIDYNDIKNNKYHKNELQDQINVWANQKKIDLVYKQGTRQMKKGFKKTLHCHIKNCNYRLVFKSDHSETDYQLDEKLSAKYADHSSSLYL